MAVERIAVVGGGGVMGSGIVQVVAAAGFQVTIVEVDEAAIERGLKRIERGLEKWKDDGSARARITGSTDLDAAGGEADHVIETVIEVLDAKVDVLRRLDAVCRDDVIFASNTSQFPISKLAAATKRADRVVGSHWFNPPPLMNLIEVIRGIETSDETLQATLDLAQRYGKETIVCKKDTPGFITSRLIASFMVEAGRIYEEGIAELEDIDKACKLGFGHAMGPLTTADLSGLDVVEHVADNLARNYGDRFLVPQTLRALVNAGHFGRKTGRGLYDYGEAR
ncbi:MAG: 3-hydroxyacyl-CoA dehydrogenase family protein [Actinobacteria bacterium]|nr:3-hydroxyacyl-CoA dehydrogenase family protein [Actinomycetota bacterium]